MWLRYLISFFLLLSFLVNRVLGTFLGTCMLGSSRWLLWKKNNLILCDQSWISSHTGPQASISSWVLLQNGGGREKVSAHGNKIFIFKLLLRVSPLFGWLVGFHLINYSNLCFYCEFDFVSPCCERKPFME